MKKVLANIESYKAGAKACGDAGQQKATNPHPPQTARALTWDNGYLDQQKLHANRDGEQSRERATLRLPKMKD
ncbi:hypothetical protein [Rhizobium sp. RAF56]|uniref:hypothetical protein n=1 Tax=Rhizobium sp. RAF56 TaxID=3233062 RepID=UPI003F9D87CA